MKKLSLDQMAEVKGGGCWGMMGGLLSITGATFTGNPWMAIVGVCIFMENYKSCA